MLDDEKKDGVSTKKENFGYELERPAENKPNNMQSGILVEKVPEVS